MSASHLARHAGYGPLFFEGIVTGKSRQMLADFFVRIADVFELGAIYKDVLVREPLG